MNANETSAHRMLMNAVEHAIENELDSFTTEEVRNNRGYVAECVATRLYQDEFLREP